MATPKITTEGFYRYGTTNFNWKNFLIIGILVLVFGITLTFFGKKIIEKIKESIAEKKLINDAKKEVEVSELSYTQTQFSSFADALHRAFKGIGTTERVVLDVFQKMKTRSDVMKLISVYGKRETGHLFFKEQLTLPEWIVAELSPKLISQINADFASKGIDYSF